jgi:hypothetical protein
MLAFVRADGAPLRASAESPNQAALTDVAARAALPPELPEPETKPVVQDEAVEPVDELLKREQCQALRTEILGKTGLPGAKGLEERRGELFARVKSEPVFFVETPEFDPQIGPTSRVFRDKLLKTDHPWDVLKQYVPRIQYRPDIGREILLRDGYLYAEDPELAFALVQQLGVHHLFNTEEVWIQRGEETLHARRKAADKYVYIDGPTPGEPVRLLLLDRVGIGKPPPALHRDLRALRYRLHFDRIKVEHITHDHLLAELRYGRALVHAVLKTEGAHVELECQIVAPEARAEFMQARERNAREQRVTQALRDVMLSQVDEGLPFDEPMHEIGQQDGQLRVAWRRAYLDGMRRFRFNGENYRVFDAKGRPQVPQVCVDFLTDTLERASGTWFRKQGEDPGRHTGLFDFEKLEGVEMRRVPGFLDFAANHPEWFEVFTTTERERVEFAQKNRFYRELVAKADDYRAGDIIMIRGFTPWDPSIMHYHSFFVFETDPVTGTPIAIVGNAGAPAIRTWEIELRRTPRRSIHHRIRPKAEWLDTIVPKTEGLSQKPPVLSRGAAT